MAGLIILAVIILILATTCVGCDESRNIWNVNSIGGVSLNRFKLSAVVKSIANLTIELEVKRQELDKMIADKQAELDALVSTKQREINNLAQEVDTLFIRRDELTAQIETLKADTQKMVLNFQQISPKIDTLNDARQAKRQERLNILLRYLSSNPYASLREAAQELDTSRQTASNYVNELTEAGKLPVGPTRHCSGRSFTR